MAKGHQKEQVGYLKWNTWNRNLFFFF